jgi:hypothetical protein
LTGSQVCIRWVRTSLKGNDFVLLTWKGILEDLSTISRDIQKSFKYPRAALLSLFILDRQSIFSQSLHDKSIMAYRINLDGDTVYIPSRYSHRSRYPRSRPRTSSFYYYYIDDEYEYVRPTPEYERIDFSYRHRHRPGYRSLERRRSIEVDPLVYRLLRALRC